jgi:hypothetical protein
MIDARQHDHRRAWNLRRHHRERAVAAPITITGKDHRRHPLGDLLGQVPTIASELAFGRHFKQHQQARAARCEHSRRVTRLSGVGRS